MSNFFSETLHRENRTETRQDCSHQKAQRGPGVREDPQVLEGSGLAL